MAYTTLAEVLNDEALCIPSELRNADDARTFLARRLMEMQTETVSETTDEYRTVLEAWEFLNDKRGEADRRASSDLVPISSATLEKLVLSLSESQQKASAAAEAAAEKTAATAEKAAIAAAQQSAEERMQDHKLASVTRASADFTKSRTLPTAAVGTAAATVWATRSDFGADFAQSGVVLWSLLAAVLLVGAGTFAWMSRRAQDDMKRVLRNLYDPDIQVEALPGLRVSFRRRDYRSSLRDRAVSTGRGAWSDDRELSEYYPRRYQEHDSVDEEYMHRGLEYDRVQTLRFEHVTDSRSGSRDLGRLTTALATVDLDDAVIDASNLALERLVAIGVLMVDIGQGEIFVRGGSRDEPDRSWM